MADGWIDAMLFVDDLAALTERLVAEETLKGIDSAWPVFTGYSKANNRIVLGGGGNYPLDPPTRPRAAGALLGQAARNMAADLQILQTHKKPDVIGIGNAVKYAADIQFQKGRGTLIYDQGGRAGLSAGVRRAMNEWPGIKRR
jgi:hypothetical protein